METVVDSRVERLVELNVDPAVIRDIERCLKSTDERERDAAEIAIAYFQAPPEIQRQVIQVLKEQDLLN